MRTASHHASTRRRGTVAMFVAICLTAYCRHGGDFHRRRHASARPARCMRAAATPPRWPRPPGCLSMIPWIMAPIPMVVRRNSRRKQPRPTASRMKATCRSSSTSPPTTGIYADKPGYDEVIIEQRFKQAFSPTSAANRYRSGPGPRRGAGGAERGRADPGLRRLRLADGAGQWCLHGDGGPGDRQSQQSQCAGDDRKRQHDWSGVLHHRVC